MKDGAYLRAFTAVGRIEDDAPYQVRQADSFHPFRRKTRYWKCRQAAIQPLLQHLTFTRGRSSWGFAFRRGVFRIEPEDFFAIAREMETDLQVFEKHENAQPSEEG